MFGRLAIKINRFLWLVGWKFVKNEYKKKKEYLAESVVQLKRQTFDGISYARYTTYDIARYIVKMNSSSRKKSCMLKHCRNGVSTVEGHEWLNHGFKGPDAVAAKQLISR